MDYKYFFNSLAAIEVAKTILRKKHDNRFVGEESAVIDGIIAFLTDCNSYDITIMITENAFPQKSGVSEIVQKFLKEKTFGLSD